MNDELPMETLYATTREEATSVAGSVRSLALGEYAAFLTLMGLLLTATTMQAAIAGEILGSGLILLSARLGYHWFYQMIRQNAFLLVGFEIPLSERLRGSPPTWILASRAASHLAIENGKPLRHATGGDLMEFLAHQWLLFAACAAGGVITVWRLLPGPIVRDWPTIALGVVAVVVWVTVIIKLSALQAEARFMPNQLAKYWLEYFAEADVANTRYIESLRKNAAPPVR